MKTKRFSDKRALLLIRIQRREKQTAFYQNICAHVLTKFTHTITMILAIISLILFSPDSFICANGDTSPVECEHGGTPLEDSCICPTPFYGIACEATNIKCNDDTFAFVNETNAYCKCLPGFSEEWPPCGPIVGPCWNNQTYDATTHQCKCSDEYLGTICQFNSIIQHHCANWILNVTSMQFLCIKCYPCYVLPDCTDQYCYHGNILVGTDETANCVCDYGFNGTVRTNHYLFLLSYYLLLTEEFVLLNVMIAKYEGNRFRIRNVEAVFFLSLLLFCSFCS